MKIPNISLNIEYLRHLSYFDFMAFLGKPVLHPGGFASTLELISRCEITTDKKVLEIGCGTGTTTALLVRAIGCLAVGLDINESMIINANKSAQRLDLDNKLFFVYADAHEIPFPSQTFDVLICEGALSFMKQKSQVISEMVQVVCSGGKIGSIEFFYPKSPPQAILQKVSEAVGCIIEPMNHSDWLDLFHNQGLRLLDSFDYPADLVQLSMTLNQAELIETYLQEVAPNLLRTDYQKMCIYIRSRLKQYEDIFNANRRHLRYGVFIWEK